MDGSCKYELRIVSIPLLISHFQKVFTFNPKRRKPKRIPDATDLSVHTVNVCFRKVRSYVGIYTPQELCLRDEEDLEMRVDDFPHKILKICGNIFV